ncbi:MAG TPA: hypothetical protein VD862_03810 [Candidatus Paceibacterota bacterium]|nr:hypothetical protein [Candidatus Paceibacterota bacterium]
MGREAVPQPAESHEQREFGFAEGVAAATDRICELYESAGRDLVVYINGSGVNVGKTHVEGAIRRELMRRGIGTSNLGSGTMSDLRWRQEHLGERDADKPHVVFFHTVTELVTRKGTAYNDMGRGDEFVPVDLFVAVYRPDKPFREHPELDILGDIVIKNEFASDDPVKLGIHRP